MNRTDELDKFDRAIKDAEVRLKSIQTNVEQIDKEISVLSPRKHDLEQNIRFHKKEGTVSIANEYRKSRNELSKIKARLILIMSEQKKAISACIQIESIISILKRDHAAIIKSFDNNVLSVSFGGNRGKK